jgi:elongation factor G
LHLDILVDRLKREFKVEANIGAPQVAYRETMVKRSSTPTPTRNSRVGLGSSPRLNCGSSPTEPGEGYSFESRIVGGAVPKEYIPGVEKGIQSVMDSAPWQASL